MDYRIIINEVRAALEEKAAREMGATGSQSAADEIASKTMELFAALRNAYLLMGEINEIWLANDISGQIIAAAQAGNSLAGYSPAMWVRWGALLPAVQAFLNAEYSATLPDGSTSAETPRQTLMRRYVQGQP
jgi:hypothetical protein